MLKSEDRMSDDDNDDDDDDDQIFIVSRVTCHAVSRLFLRSQKSEWQSPVVS